MFNIAEEIAKRKPRGKVIQSYPDEKAELVSKRLEGIKAAYKQKPVKSDEELDARVDEYFDSCIKSGRHPTVETMCLYLGYTRQWANNIMTGYRKGFTPQTVDILKRAYETLSAYDAELVTEGKIHPTSYIFRAKNYHGMKDNQEVTITANTTDDTNADDIRDKYIKEHYPIDTTAKEVEN